MRRATHYLIIFTLFYFKTFSQNLSQTVRGLITDEDSRLPIPGATITIEGNGKLLSAASNAEGTFKFKEVSPGRYIIRVTCIGYENMILPNIVVNSGKETLVSISLKESVLSLKAVEIVTVDKNKGQALNDMVLAGGRSISPEQTNRFAGGFNDPSRILSNFPGVTSTLDGSNDIIVRGNSAKYVQWRLEGLQISNPNHFADQSAVAGSISVLNNNLLATSDFYTSAFSAEFGDALSGIYDVKLRAGNNEKTEGIAGLGLLGTELTIEGPFSKGYKGSYLFNYRYSTVSLLNNLGLTGDLNAEVNFQDAALKIVLPTRSIGEFSLFALGGASNIRFDDVKPDTWQTPGNRFIRNKTGEDFKKKSYLLNTGLNHTLSLGRKSNLVTSLAYSREGIDDEVLENFLYKIYNSNGDFVKDSSVKGQLNFDGRIIKSTYRAEMSLNHKINPKHKIQAGIKYALQNFEFNQSVLRDSSFVRYSLVNTDENLSTIRTYVNWRFRMSESFSTVVGIHNMNVLLNNKSTFEPRASVLWKIDKSQSINAGYGLHSSQESLHHYFAKVQAPNGSIKEPNRDLDLLKAQHFVLGYEKRFSRNMMFKVEAYYQYLYDLPVAASDTNLFATINEGLDFQYLELVNKGTGKNYGIELTLERFFHKNYYYMINASIYNSTYKALDGIERNTRFNGNYLVNALFGREFPKLGKKHNKTIAINSRAFVGGGKKIIPLLRGSDGNLAVDPATNKFYDYSRAYKKGLDDAYSLTLSISLKIDKKRATHELFLNIDNITNNRAKLSEFYDPSEPSKIGYLKQGQIFPNLMYRVYF